MSQFLFTITKRLHKSHIRYFQTLHSLSSTQTNPSLQHFTNPFFSQAFRRTPSPRHNFSTFQPISSQIPYDPIDFNLYKPQCNSNSHLGISQFVELLRKTKEIASKKEEAIEFVLSSGVEVNEKDIGLAMWVLRDDCELALLGFELCVKCGFVNERLLGLIVWVLGTHHKFDVAWSLIRDLHSLVDTRQALLAIIDRYAAANLHEKAIKTFHFMEKLSASPDQNAFYTVMSALCRYGNVEEAEEFMLKNKKLFPLECEGYNIILHAWCNITVDVIEAKRVWREMASNCITPDAKSYTHMVSMFSKAGNLFDSLRLYDEMKKRNWPLGLEVYNSLIYVMTREKCFGEAINILDKIKEMGLQPNSESYNCLICPLCEAGKFDEARALLVAMTRDGSRPTLETYHAFLKAVHFESTLELLGQMKKDKIGPDGSTFLLIFEKFFKLRQPENSLKIWVEMRDFEVPADSTHYMSIICGLVDCGCFAKAKELHLEMLSNGFIDDPKVKKLLESDQCLKGGRVGSMSEAGHVNKYKGPSTSNMRPHRRNKRGGKNKKMSTNYKGSAV